MLYDPQSPCPLTFSDIENRLGIVLAYRHCDEGQLEVAGVEDALHVKRALKEILAEERVLGVETGACPHTAVREDPGMNLAALEALESQFPDTDLTFVESGGDNLTLTFSPALVDYFIYVIDVGAGDKIPRKDGPGITQSDLLVINKVDLAPYIDANLEVMERDSRLMRRRVT